MTARPVVMTPERLALLRAQWPAVPVIPTKTILAAFNALPGNQVDGGRLAALAAQAGVRRGVPTPSVAARMEKKARSATPDVGDARAHGRGRIGSLLQANAIGRAQDVLTIAMRPKRDPADDAAVEQFIRQHGVTRCPAATGGVETAATLPADDRHIIHQHNLEQEAARLAQFSPRQRRASAASRHAAAMRSRL